MTQKELEGFRHHQIGQAGMVFHTVRLSKTYGTITHKKAIVVLGSLPSLGL